MAENTQTQQQINTLRTLQESYNALVEAQSAQATATALEAAKQAILTAIGAIDTSDLAKEATLGTPLAGQPSTIFAAIAASKGATPQAVADAVVEELANRYSFPVSYDGVVSSTPIESVLGAIMSKEYITEIDDTKISSLPSKWSTYGITNCSKLRLRNCISLANTCFQSTVLEEISLDIYTTFDFQVFRGNANLKRVYIPLISGGSSNADAQFLDDVNLIDIECGSAWNGDVYALRGNNRWPWNPTNALSSSSAALVTDREDEDGNPIESNLDQLLYNIRRHIAANIPTTTSGWTIYFGDDIKAAILADSRTTDAFTNKGWTVA